MQLCSYACARGRAVEASSRCQLAELDRGCEVGASEPLPRGMHAELPAGRAGASWHVNGFQRSVLRMRMLSCQCMGKRQKQEVAGVHTGSAAREYCSALRQQQQRASGACWLCSSQAAWAALVPPGSARVPERLFVLSGRCRPAPSPPQHPCRSSHYPSSSLERVASSQQSPAGLMLISRGVSKWDHPPRWGALRPQLRRPGAW